MSSQHRLTVDSKKVDTKEFELPETLFVRDIDNRVIQGIASQVLAGIDGVCPIQGNWMDNLLGRAGQTIQGIIAEQDLKAHTIHIRVEVSIRYGVCIPEKAEEIQSKIAEQITELTGLHVATVHVIFKNLLIEEATANTIARLQVVENDEYSDQFP